MGDNVYEIVIEGMEDQYRATVTRIADGMTLTFVSRFRWWLSLWYTNGFYLGHAFKQQDKVEARKKYKQHRKQ